MVVGAYTTQQSELVKQALVMLAAQSKQACERSDADLLEHEPLMIEVDIAITHSCSTAPSMHACI